MRLKDKVAIVTGAASGIGYETAKLFAQEGAAVVIADRNGPAAAQVADSLPGAMAITVDVASEAEVKAMVAQTVARHGRIDVLVNNAGFGFVGTVVDIEEADWDALMAVNIKGVYLCCKHAIPIMARGGGGTIVNTASAVAAVGIPGRAAYVASKGAVAALTRAMALDHVAQNIRVNAVGPGTIETPYYTQIFAQSPDAASLRRSLEARQPMERMGTPLEIANAILFLASDESSFCTGTILFADGGWTAR